MSDSEVTQQLEPAAHNGEEATEEPKKPRGKKAKDGASLAGNAYANMLVKRCDDQDISIPGIDDGAPDHLVKLHGKRVRSAVSDVLQASVLDSGVQTPIKVIDIGGTLWVIDGVQRLRALRDANKQREVDGRAKQPVPYQLVMGLSAAQQFKLGIALNNSSKTDDVIEQSAKAAELMRLLMAEGKTMSAAQQDVADAAGVSKSLVEGLIKAHEATPALKSSYDDGVINASVLIQLAGLPAPEQELAATEARKIVDAGGKKMTTSAAKDRVKKVTGQYKTGKCYGDPALFKAIVRAHIDDGVAEMDKDTLMIMRLMLKQVELADGWNQVKGLRASIAYVTGESTKANR